MCAAAAATMSSLLMRTLASRIVQPSSCMVMAVRGEKKARFRPVQIVRHEWPGGEKHNGFTYYPRPGEQDPPYNPSKLLMVQRIKRYSGIPYWCKRVLAGFGLDHNIEDVAIIRNTAYTNEKLHLVKHLVKITPITFPDGEPKESDHGYTQLNDKGELRIYKTLQGSQDSVDAATAMRLDPRLLDPATLQRDSLRRWEKNPFMELL